jgi:hypothetical protein
MRTLLIEPTPAGSASLARDLDAAGHDVVRCHPPGGPAFPCAGLTDTCPLDHALPIDVAIAVRDQASSVPTADEGAVTCAIRVGLPVVVVGPDGPNPFATWSEPCADPADVGAASARAIATVAERRAAPLVAEVERLVALEGVDAGAIDVTVERFGDLAAVTVRTEHPLPQRVIGVVATRVHAVDQVGSWPTTKLSVDFKAAPAPRA